MHSKHDNEKRIGKRSGKRLILTTNVFPEDVKRPDLTLWVQYRAGSAVEDVGRVINGHGGVKVALVILIEDVGGVALSHSVVAHSVGSCGCALLMKLSDSFGSD